MDKRVSWDDYFMSIATAVAARGTCDRRRVGAVIVLEKMIVATGYNGSIRGLPHCDEEGHLMVAGHCERTVHAEANAVAQAAYRGIATAKATMYVTTFPCLVCFKQAVNAGIERFVFVEPYVDRAGQVVRNFAEVAGVEMVCLGKETV